MLDFEKPMVFRANRLMRVRQVRCVRSILWVCCFPTAGVSKLRGRGYTPACSVYKRARPNGRNQVCNCQKTSSSWVPHTYAKTMPCC